ncbi:hypothetical protein CDA63_09195 [Hymenobacter amundsenii]|uniref:Uncharacterized protein n=1 Tax=Hymenobacter amundsenii TaxID=2006685 RepID=A0A246FKX6_9BACT|nr:hypothetical protein CDA63_09195 [Hymenobacter amundsenii]
MLLLVAPLFTSRFLFSLIPDFILAIFQYKTAEANPFLRAVPFHVRAIGIATMLGAPISLFNLTAALVVVNLIVVAISFRMLVVFFKAL